jgi:hypothetical protein
MYSLKNPKNKTIVVITVISAFICGCPGMLLLFNGVPNLIDGTIQIAFIGEYFEQHFYQFIAEYWIGLFEWAVIPDPIEFGDLPVDTTQQKSALGVA